MGLLTSFHRFANRWVRHATFNFLRLTYESGRWPTDRYRYLHPN
jgi:hypothetical protein